MWWAVKALNEFSEISSQFSRFLKIGVSFWAYLLVYKMK